MSALRPTADNGAGSSALLLRTQGDVPPFSQTRSLTMLLEKVVKIGAKVVSHGPYVTFQLAEVAVPKELFRKLLSLLDDLRRRPVPA